MIVVKWVPSEEVGKESKHIIRLLNSSLVNWHPFQSLDQQESMTHSKRHMRMGVEAIEQIIPNFLVSDKVASEVRRA
eukprot:scaffold185483_cov23-Tisochrysis_lutea.AAC.1